MKTEQRLEKNVSIYGKCLSIKSWK
jgi:hypothetical protein